MTVAAYKWTAAERRWLDRHGIDYIGKPMRARSRRAAK